MSLKLAIWDMDGTLVDSRELIQTAMQRAFSAIGLPPPLYDDTRKTIGLSLDVALRQLAPDHDDLDGLVSAYRRTFLAYRAEPDFSEPLYPGALATLQRLADDNWTIGMATGKRRGGIDALFEAHPLAHYFDTTWCADDGPGKPDPFMCEQAMNAVGAAPHQTLIIGDAVHDITMGRNAGIHTIGVSWGFGEAHELEAVGAHEVHNDFASLNAGLDAFAAARV